MTKFIVHIGPHKTGTTYIQETLAALRVPLFERGIHVPSIWDAAPGLPSHMQVAWAIRNRDLTKVRDQLRDILARRPDHVVISCEALSRFDPDQVGQLRQLLGSAPAQVVYYVRRPPERLPSLWQENVKHGQTMTFSEFIEWELRRYDVFEAWDTSVLDSFSAVFGPDRIRVVSYSYLVDNGLDIAEHFLAAFLGLRDIVLPGIGRPNGSMTAWDIELIRALNAIHARHGGETSAALRGWFLSHKDRLVPKSVPGIMRENLGAIRLNERQLPLLLPSRQVLARYGASLVPPWHKDTLHELRVTDVPFVRRDYLLEPIVTQTLHEIYETYLRQNPPP